MANFGRKHICTNPDCGIKFYDFRKPEPICPKCKRRVSELEEKEILERRSKRVVEEEPAAEEEEEEKAKEKAAPEDKEEGEEQDKEEEEEGLEEVAYIEDKGENLEDYEHDYEE